MKKQKVYYFKTLSDEVEIDDIKPKKIDKNFKYETKNPFLKFWEWFYYRVIIFPIGWFWCRIKKGIKYVGAKKIRKLKTGCFVYGNHTNKLSDAFSPSMISHQKKPYLIVNPKNLNLPFFGASTKYLGAVPLPDGIEAHKNFLKSIEHKLKKNHPIIIYPEAKIWPCYTKIRPFDSQSFRYPIKFDVPVFSVTTTYQKNKRGKCKIVVYVDGPFEVDKTLNPKEAQQKLHEQVIMQMQKRSELSNFETYVYKQL